MSEKKPVLDAATRERIKRDALFVPCVSKEHLHRWIKVYLGLDLPNTIVCDDDVTNPPSNSSPMDLVWEIYSKALDGTDEDFQRVLAYAARGSFKCTQKGTKILTRERGLKNIEDTAIGDVIWSGVSWQPVTNWIHDGVKESVEIETETGIRLTTSPIHRVWAWEPDKKPDWKRCADLTENDLVCLDTAHGFGGPGSTNQEEYDIGYLCGILQGDGCLTMMNKYNIIVLTTKDDHVRQKWMEACERYAERRPPNPKPERPYDYRINSAQMCRVAKSWGLKNCYAHEKEVPAIVYSSRSYMTGFVSGLLDTDGTVTQKGSVEFPLTAERLLRELQVILAALGVRSRFRSCKRKYGLQNHIIHNVIVNQNDIPELLKSGVCLSAQKATAIDLNPKNVNVHDSIPRTHFKAFCSSFPSTGGRAYKGSRKPNITSYPTVSRDKLLRLLRWAEKHRHLSQGEVDYWDSQLKNAWVRVVAKNTGVADFYDLTVANDHSYWSNGIISHNTVACSVIEILALLHLNRSVVHGASIEAQAHICQGYIAAAFRRPYLRDFLTSKNKRLIEVTRYIHTDGSIINKSAFDALPELEKSEYTCKLTSMTIAVCTMGGMNGHHSNLLVLDELDLSPPGPLEEAKAIPCKGENGELPITFMTSSRKFSFGEVQKAIDSAHETKLVIRHWNVIDVTEKCKPERHRPDLPKIPIYYNEHTLNSIPRDEYDLLSPEEQVKWIEGEGYSGCLMNCSLFSVCRARLADKQASNSKLLLSVADVKSKISGMSPEFVRSQLMSWQPSAEGLIYPYLSRGRHMLDASQMYEKITGEPAPPQFGLSRLIQLMIDRNMTFHMGMDHGYTHNWAITLGGLDGNRLFIFDAMAVPGLELNEKVELCKAKYKYLDPTIYADPAYPSDIKTFRRNGFRCKNFTKDVMLGIDAVRSKLTPGMNKQPEMFFLAGQPGVENLFFLLCRYHWKIEPGTELATDIPDEKDDDLPDSLRYLCQNLFGSHTKFTAALNEVGGDGSVPTQQNWLGNKIRQLTGGDTGGVIKGKKGSFHFDV